MSTKHSDPPKGDEDRSGESNPFDPERLRLAQRYGQGLSVRRALASVPVRKPHRQEFIRTHPDPGMRIEVFLLELKEERQNYLVAPDLATEIPEEAVPKILVSSITRAGLSFLWPIRLPDERGQLDDWNAAAHVASDLAQTRWIRLAANMGAGTYDVHEALGPIPEPLWPDVGLQDLLEIAFKGRLIENLDHPVLRRLRGER